ncbi:hypothetical protein Hanom_Chr14g01270861 [Helianthus anomalus]
MSHITQHEGANLISNLPNPLIIPISRVSTPTTDNQLRSKVQSFLFHLFIINVPSLLTHLIRQTLEVNRSRTYLLPTRCIVSMRQMPT